MDTSQVLHSRAGEPGGLSTMAVVSACAHVVLMGALLLAPGGWLAPKTADVRPVMTISLGGGAPGPQNGGMTTAGGRAIQTQAPPEPPARREAVRPPAARTPEMVVPKPGAVPLKQIGRAHV